MSSQKYKFEKDNCIHRCYIGV